MIKVRKDLDQKDLQGEDVWKIASKDGTIVLRPTAAKKEVRLAIIGVDDRLDLEGISRAIFYMLKGGGFLECKKVILGGVKFSKYDSEEQISKKIEKNLSRIQANTGWKFD